MPTPGDILEALDREVGRRVAFWQRLTAPQLFVGSFLGLIAFGTLLLLVLPGIYTGPRLSFVDALFTVTSAVCITGLIVVDTATYFTPFGQAVLLLLIQLGGLGVLAFTTVIVVLLGRRLSVRGESAATSASLPDLDTSQVLTAIFRYTFLIELLGAIALWVAWAPELGAVGAVWPAIFHSVSAFCNAGFSTFSDNMVGFFGDPVTLSLIAFLAVLGGLGFIVLEEVRLVLRNVRRQLSLHTKLVIYSTGVLILAGWVLILAFEWNNTLAPLPWWQRVVDGFFLSAVPRTSGFNTIDYTQATNGTLFITMLLMLIGGAPGSTAGGLKVTTIAILVALAIARVRGQLTANAFRRSIAEGAIQRAVGLVIFALAILAVAVMVLQVSELQGLPHAASGAAFMELTFEAVSAFDTVGLSLGITAGLTSVGKLVLIVLMYVGRVGPFTFVASMAVAAARTPHRYRYATEDVIVG